MKMRTILLSWLPILPLIAASANAASFKYDCRGDDDRITVIVDGDRVELAGADGRVYDRGATDSPSAADTWATRPANRGLVRDFERYRIENQYYPHGYGFFVEKKMQRGAASGSVLMQGGWGDPSSTTNMDYRCSLQR